MHVTVDTGLCQAYANCVAAAPLVFDLDDAAGVATVLVADPPAEWHDEVQDAVRLCPVRAVVVAPSDGDRRTG